MKHALLHRVDVALSRWLPEQRLFIKSDTTTRFVRLTPLTLATALGVALLAGAWVLGATAFVVADKLAPAGGAATSEITQALNAERLDTLASERDQRAAEARAAQDRFTLALQEVSRMQSALLASEKRRHELEAGLAALQTTLARMTAERDAARSEAMALSARMEGDATAASLAQATTRQGLEDTRGALRVLADALDSTASARSRAEAEADAALQLAEALAYERQLTAERNEHIFTRVEEALSIAVAPMEKVFRSVGLSADDLIAQVRDGYAPATAGLTPVALSTKGAEPDADMLRAQAILAQIDQFGLYRAAAEKTPLAHPVRGAYRFTSPFGTRRDPITGARRQHEGVDFAGPTGTAIHATADGVVTEAGWASGYGRTILIRHAFGLETRYAHLSRIRVKKGDRVSRGERIGDMGNSGRSTGPHLHYEVRVGGDTVNPMTFIKAGRDVF